MITFDYTNKKFTDSIFHTVAIGRAYELLRGDLAQQLAEMQKELRFRYCRCHGLFHEDMAVAIRKPDGTLGFQWHHMDKFIDTMLSVGLKPFFELGPMPYCMASDPKATIFHYEMNMSKPTDYNEWYALCRAFTSHCVDRYGLDEVRTWFFEVWNEPNLDGFWPHGMDEYYILYSYAAKAVKSVDSELPVGGPASAGGMFIPEMIDYCLKNDVPLDFVSTHVYPIGEYCQFPERKNSPHALGGYMPTVVREVYERVQNSPMPNLPIYWTEWNTQYGKPGMAITWTHNPSVDMHFAASSVMKNVLETREFSDSMSYWTASDLFEEAGCPHSPFSCTYGLLTIHGVKKATYNAYKLLRKLRGKELAAAVENAPFGCDVCATEENNVSRVILYNWNALEIHDQPDWTDSVKIPVREEGEYLVTTAAIRKHKGSPYETWISMGSPHNLSETQLAMLQAHSEMDYDFVSCKSQDGFITVPFALAPNEVLYMECEKKGDAIIPRAASKEDLERWNEIMTLEELK